MEHTLIYPNQLFDINPSCSKNRKLLIIEDPLFFGDHKYPINFHKKKLMLHYLSIRRYANNKREQGYQVEIIKYTDLMSANYTEWIIKKYLISVMHICDVVDFELRKRIDNASRNLNVTVKWYQNPNFLLSQTDVDNDFKGKKRHFMANFYKKQRKRFDVLMDSDGNPRGGRWSFDVDNRKKLPKNLELPDDFRSNYEDNELIACKAFIEKEFSSNYGDITGFNYPIDHNQALESINYFLTKKFRLFGPYEDAVSQKNSTLFHSVLTPYLNIGLITPKQVLDIVVNYAENENIPINSFEGFVRQIIGWREFIRGIYVSEGVRQRTTNFWKFDKKITESFYNGSTNVLPVDRTIDKLIDNAYIHHIERLMVMGNFMFLLKIHPNDVYKWFMELHIDAYDWVMVPNVYGMSQFSDGGIMSTKPYISGSNYILKMSDYKKGEWCDIWDALYWNFINENRDFFKKNPRTSMMINMYDRKSDEMKKKYTLIEENIKI